MNYYEKENVDVLQNFDIREVIQFTEEHDLQVIRLADYQYQAYIDGKGYSSAFTPLGAIRYGILSYNQHKNKP